MGAFSVGVGGRGLALQIGANRWRLIPCVWMRRLIFFSEGWGAA